MWAVAAQPQTGLTPMIPTPSVDSDMARVESYSKLEASAGVELNRSEARPTTVSGAFGMHLTRTPLLSQLDDAVLATSRGPQPVSKATQIGRASCREKCRA